jgi:hypothetical protein
MGEVTRRRSAKCGALGRPAVSLLAFTIALPIPAERR